MGEIGPGDNDDVISVTLQAFAKSQEEALRIAEVFNRTLVGLALDGTHANLTMMRISPEEGGWDGTIRDSGI